MIEFALTIVFWALVFLGVATTVVWIAVAVVLAIVETRRAHRERPGEESSTVDDPFSVLRESATVAPEVIGRTPQGDTP